VPGEGETRSGEPTVAQETVPIRSSCSTAAVEVAEKQADAAVISSYALALLEGCKTIEKGSLRVVGETRPLPFIAACATPQVPPEEERQLTVALLALREDPALLAAMESRDGFVRPRTQPSEAWTDWRGPRRDGIATSPLPATLPRMKQVLWKQPLTGPGLSGITATGRHAIVADKSADGANDVFRCFDADTGTPLWTLAYPASGEMDFANCPRAQPVIHGELVYLLGAFGHLHCLRLDTGEVVWKRNLIEDFGAKLPRWGMCATPLVADGKLVVNLGAAGASLVALDLSTGKAIWRSPGRPAAYSSFIFATFGGVRQIVGYDATSLGGWDPQTGKRLWELIPELEGDYNVPTPIALDGKLMVATENNGTRLYGFGPGGRIQPKPLAQNRDLAPDASTPVVLDGLVFGCSRKLVCLDARDGLKTLWTAEDGKAFDDYVSIIGGGDRLLVTTSMGELLLVRASRQRYELISRLPLFDEKADVWSHPALVGNRLYIRNQSALLCIQTDAGSDSR
jgi:outer membrane protein assembly factor BamB